MTPLSNLVPVALLDIAALVLLVVLALGFARRVRASGLRARPRLGRGEPGDADRGRRCCCSSSLWGLNYRRVPLEQKLEYDRSRVTREAARDSAATRCAKSTRLHAPAHGPIDAGALSRQSADARGGVRRRRSGCSAANRLAVPGVPETFAARALLPRRGDRRHDRSVLPRNHRQSRTRCRSSVPSCWRTSGRTSPATRTRRRPTSWPGWPARRVTRWRATADGWPIFEHVVASLPRADRTTLTSQLAAGPRRDLQAAAARYARARPSSATAARDVYDTYLRANRVNEGWRATRRSCA